MNNEKDNTPWHKKNISFASRDISASNGTNGDGFTITNVEHGGAIICGINIDQAALHGVLMKVRDLGLPLLAVSRVAADELPGG